MKLLDNVDYYEVLEVPRSASPSDIRQARQKLLDLYQNNPVVADSFFDVKEKKRIIEAIETAFAVLSDPNKKAEYDQTHCLGNSSSGLQKDRSSEATHSPADRHGGVVSPLLPKPLSLSSTSMMKKIETSSLTDKTQGLLADISKQKTISGQDIQHLRESLDLSIEQVFEVTRINSATIQSIEGDQFDDLPPQVYLKSFLKTYAQVLRLKPDKLADGFLKHMAVTQSNK